ncbi:MAG: MarR family winged helix-turn-helix transcriptional regulator [Lachnospiraceae bacterium]
MEEIQFGPTIKKISEELDRKATLEIRKYKLTLSQARVILFLADKGTKKATQKELEELLQVSHPTTVTIIKSMVTKNMVETSFDETDRRMKIVKLTWGSEELYEELRQNARNMEKRLLRGFTKEEKKQFFEFLTRAGKNAATDS